MSRKKETVSKVITEEEHAASIVATGAFFREYLDGTQVTSVKMCDGSYERSWSGNYGRPVAFPCLPPLFPSGLCRSLPYPHGGASEGGHLVQPVWIGCVPWQTSMELILNWLQNLRRERMLSRSPSLWSGIGVGASWELQA